MESFFIKGLDAKYDDEILKKIVKYEEEIFGEGAIGTWNIKPFAKYGKIFVLMNNKKKIASVVEVLNSFDKEKAYIYGLFTVRNYEKKGFAKKLLKYTVDYLKKVEIKIIELTVQTTNTRAISLYENTGFKVIEELEDEYGDGNKRYLMSMVI